MKSRIRKFILIFILILVLLYLGVRSISLYFSFYKECIQRASEKWCKQELTDSFASTDFIFGIEALLLLLILIYFANRYSNAIHRGFLLGGLLLLPIFYLIAFFSISDIHYGTFYVLIPFAIVFVLGIFFGKLLETSSSEILTMISSYAFIVFVIFFFVATMAILTMDILLESSGGSEATQLAITLFIAWLVAIASFWFGSILKLRRLWKKDLVSKFIVIGIILAIIGGLVLSYYADKKEAERRMAHRDKVRATAYMSRIRAIAELYYGDMGGYTGLTCDVNKDISYLCDRIENGIKMKPVIQATKEDYCTYIKLGGEEYYCIDSRGVAEKTTINPDGENYCNGITFVCPQE